MSLNRNLPPVGTNRFSMVPRNDVPRSKFVDRYSHKTTFDAGYLVPIHVDEVLPGDHHKCRVTVFARPATMLFPPMDNMKLSTFFFFVPARLLWSNWKKFMGEQINPADSINFTIPQVVSPAGGWAVGSLADYFGLPTAGQITGGNTVSTNVLPLRAYQLIWSEWFRDQNLQNTEVRQITDGPDTNTWFVLKRRNKKHDYFTACLPWPLKGGVDVTLPLGTTAPVIPDAVGFPNFIGGSSGTNNTLKRAAATNPSAANLGGNTGTAGEDMKWGVTTGLVANLAGATAATINALRLAITTQQLLERDARGGTRYTEMLRSHFGVMPEDARLQRPEYIGGGESPVISHAIPQTSPTAGGDAKGSLAATSIVEGQHHFSYHATEHGYIIGLAHVGADLTYQQGLPKMWTRQTRLDFYFPVFANLGEQAVLLREIYVQGTAADTTVFGYQERWAEYRHYPSRISGEFRSTCITPLDAWHLAQKFTAAPTLNDTFMQDTPPMSRVLSAGALADGAQILFDSLFELERTRPLPMFSVPGLTRF